MNFINSCEIFISKSDANTDSLPQIIVTIIANNNHQIVHIGTAMQLNSCYLISGVWPIKVMVKKKIYLVCFTEL